jgi:hypothetical protein
VRRLLLVLLFTSATTPLAAQWRVTLVRDNAASSGDSRSSTDPGHPELRAEHPATWSLAIGRQSHAWRASIDIHRSVADLAEVSASSTVMSRSLLKAWGPAIELARRIAGRDGAAELFAAAGASADRWSFDLSESSPRWRITARAALEAGFPIGSGWSGVMRWQLLAGPSVFTAAELPEGFLPRTGVRLGVGLGVSRTLGATRP